MYIATYCIRLLDPEDLLQLRYVPSSRAATSISGANWTRQSLPKTAFWIFLDVLLSTLLEIIVD